MQKTLTINKKRYTGKQIAKMFIPENETKGGDFAVKLGDQTYYANYRQIQDAYFAPVCDANEANAIALMPEYSYSYDIWLEL